MGVHRLGELYSFEDKNGVGDSDADKPTLSYTEIFYKCLPQYLAMGMSADEFWNCDPRMYQVYREKQKIELEKENERLWLQGMYVYQAILLTAPRLNSLQPKEPLEYPSEPFDLGLRKDEEEKDIDELTKEEIQSSPQFTRVLDWALRVNKGKGEANGGHTNN